MTALDIPHKGGRTFGYRVLRRRPTRWRTSPTTDRTGRTRRPGSRRRALQLAGGVDVLVHGAPFAAGERAIADLYGHATVDDDRLAPSRVAPDGSC